MPSLKRDWRVADLANLPDDGNRYEVIDGELFVTPAPSFDHQTALQVLFRTVSEYVERERIGYAFIAPADVTFSERRGVQPDLFVMPGAAGRRPRRFEDAPHLLLAVEVISPSTGRADRVAKRTVYREEGVEEYWIVDLDARAIERSTPANAHVDVLSSSIEWQPAGAAQPLAIDLADYFRRVLED